MDINAVFREVGQATAEICGTTHKTVKRAVVKAEVLSLASSGSLMQFASSKESCDQQLPESEKQS